MCMLRHALAQVRTRHATVELATGGARMRDMVGIHIRGALYDYHHAHDADGCLDAPQTLPAGACNCIDWTDWRGNPIAGQTEIDR